MNLALVILKSGPSLVAWTEQLEAEPRVHMFRPHVITGKTKLSLTPWPDYTEDEHVLLSSDVLLTVCEPTEKVAKLYTDKVAKPEPVETDPILLNEDSLEQDDYEPRYVEDPLY